MKRNTLVFRFFAFWAVLVLLTLSLCSCGGEKIYSDVSLRELTDAVFAAGESCGVDRSAFVGASADFIDMNFDFIPDPANDVLFLPVSGKVNDQIGIFKRSTPEEAQELADAMKPLFEIYVEDLKRVAQMYPGDDAAAEMEKLNNARITVYGQYVFLTILGKPQTNALEKAFVGKISE